MSNALETVVGMGIAIVVIPFAAAFYVIKGLVWLTKQAFARSEQHGTTSTVDALATQSQTAPAIHVIDSAEVRAQTVLIEQSLLAAEPRSTQHLRSVADFHITVQFSDSFTATVSVFKEEKVVRRKIRAISMAAGELMRTLYLRESFDLPDVKLENGRTYEDAVLDTETLGIRFIEDLLSPKAPQYFKIPPPPVVVGVGSNDVSKSVQADPEATARALAILRGEAASSDGSIENAASTDTCAQSSHATVRVEQKPARRARAITVGKLLEAGMRNMLFQTNNTGPTFEALIECDDGEFTSLRGVRLQELFKENGIEVGDHIEVVSLGRTQVTIPGGESKFRNEYQVKVLKRLIERV